jgi:hypothetical protein
VGAVPELSPCLPQTLRFVSQLQADISLVQCTKVR